MIPVVGSKQDVILSLHISSDDYLYYYKGKAKYILAVSHDGKRVRFPASALQRFLTHKGISGQFRLCYDEHNKMISIEKIHD